MELKLVIEMEEKTRACIEKLTEALTTGESVINISSPQIVEKTTEVVKKATKSKAKSKVEEPVWTPQDTAITDEVQEEKPQAPVEAPTPQAATPSFTLDQLRAGGVEASNLGKGSSVKDLLNNKYKVEKLNDLPAEKYNEFAEDLRSLGVRI
ncbi:MAG: hypothetical protein HXM47_07665 [Pseudoleptotrichia goodfellowii]|nr:hypothetical protein [Pseudoleptotrichia goodfellowii]